jgi:hypothetical protein
VSSGESYVGVSVLRNEIAEAQRAEALGDSKSQSAKGQRYFGLLDLEGICGK